jgi:hypothetical protein
VKLDWGSGANRIVMLGVVVNGSGLPTAVQYNGVSMTKLVDYGGVHVQIYYLLDAALPPSAGTYDLVVNMGTAYDGAELFWAEPFGGVKQSTPAVLTGTGTGTTTLQFPNSPSNSLLVDVLATQDGFPAPSSSQGVTSSSALASASYATGSYLCCGTTSPCGSTWGPGASVAFFRAAVLLPPAYSQ